MAQDELSCARPYTARVFQGETPVRRDLRVGCEFRLQLPWPVHAIVQVEPQPHLEVSEPLFEVTPAVPVHSYVDGFGNLCRRFDADPGPVGIRFEARAQTPSEPDPVHLDARQHPVSELPDEVLVYTLASRYCQTDVLATTAWRLFGDVPEGWSRVQAVCDWVHENLTFSPGSSGPSTSATDVYLRREGVCRDFAQLAVTFLRALNVPARYCFGYLPDIDVPVEDEPMDFVAWLEAYLGGAWYTFDPRNNRRRTGRVLIGRGRDALDVAMLTTFGSAPLVALRVAAEEASAEPWSSALRPVVGSFTEPWG